MKQKGYTNDEKGNDFTPLWSFIPVYLLCSLAMLTSGLIDYAMYYFFVGTSLSLMIGAGLYFGEGKLSYKFKNHMLLRIIAIWIMFYFIALGVEWFGHCIGLWHWYNTNHIFLHCAVWWANVMTVSALLLSRIKDKLGRYCVFLDLVLVYQVLQELLIHFVTHYPLFGSPYYMIFIVMAIVCLTTLDGVGMLKRLRLVQ